MMRTKILKKTKMKKKMKMKGKKKKAKTKTKTKKKKKKRKKKKKKRKKKKRKKQKKKKMKKKKKKYMKIPSLKFPAATHQPVQASNLNHNLTLHQAPKREIRSPVTSKRPLARNAR